MASIRKRNGRYQVQIRLPGKPALSKTFGYKHDAKRWARDTERQLERGELYQSTEAVLFQQLIDQYELRHLPLLKSIKQEQSLVRRISARLGKTHVSEITNQRLASYRDLRFNEVSAQTVKHEINFIRRILKLAQSEWGIQLPQGIPSIRLPRLPNGRIRQSKTCSGCSTGSTWKNCSAKQGSTRSSCSTRMDLSPKATIYIHHPPGLGSEK